MLEVEDLSAIAYTSRARRPMTMAELDELAVASSGHNATFEVTGALLHDGETFFQYLEGPPQGIGRAYERIEGSSLHTILSRHYAGPVARRYFPDWLMASRLVQPGSLVALSAERWSRNRMLLARGGEMPDALRQLLAFWEG